MRLGCAAPCQRTTDDLVQHCHTWTGCFWSSLCCYCLYRPCHSAAAVGGGAPDVLRREHWVEACLSSHLHHFLQQTHHKETVLLGLINAGRGASLHTRPKVLNRSRDASGPFTQHGINVGQIWIHLRRSQRCTTAWRRWTSGCCGSVCRSGAATLRSERSFPPHYFPPLYAIRHTTLHATGFGAGCSYQSDA